MRGGVVGERRACARAGGVARQAAAAWPPGTGRRLVADHRSALRGGAVGGFAWVVVRIERRGGCRRESEGSPRETIQEDLQFLSYLLIHRPANYDLQRYRHHRTFSSVSIDERAHSDSRRGRERSI